MKVFKTTLARAFFLISFFLFTDAVSARDGKPGALQNLNIVFVGNSITRGSGLKDPANTAAPVMACSYLEGMPGLKKVSFLNIGKGGSTTVDWLPSTGTLFGNILKSADSLNKGEEGLLVFSMMLGTNDSAIEGPRGAPVAPEQYRANLRMIADSLLRAYPSCIIVFHRPLWYSTSTYNRSRYLAEGLARLQTYFPQIEALVKEYSGREPDRVFMGDRKAYRYLRKHSSELYQAETGQQGVFYLHPNEKGAAVLGRLWADKIGRIALRHHVKSITRENNSIIK